MIKSNHIMWWLLSIVISAAAIGAIGYKWFLVQRIHGVDINVVRNSSDLKKLLQARDTVEFKNGRRPYHIPTGFFIQSLAFMTPSDINITGYIWQKYPEDFPKDIQKGFIFPEEVTSANTILKKAYTYEGTENKKTYELTGWYFDVTVRQSFDYSNYPLDFLTVWIRLWAEDFANDNRVLFVPDFKSYARTDRKTFGLDLDIVPGEWEIDETFFSYNNIPYDTNFGFFNEVKDHSYKEFFINLGMQRKFINAFVINLVPLFVVALLLFAQMMIVTGSQDLVDKFGFSTSGAIATCSALFFVVLLAHVQVRSQFSGSGLVYIEYFYLVMYIVILLIALNAYVFSLGKLRRFNLIHYRDNFIPKVAYWPIVLWSMAIVTWIKI
ncbi:MAG: hypothetical protein HKM93_17135 [Desulfobacteraceae bacterium]|nr:hypothetical protein [Desulfobacteraceae bacterium]